MTDSQSGGVISPPSTLAMDTSPQDAAHRTENEEIRAKRIACDICRQRKLKCDGVRSGCSTCVKTGRPCVYNEVRRKSGPKRGYVKTLEARIAQMETKLKEASAAIESNLSPNTAMQHAAPQPTPAHPDCINTRVGQFPIGPNEPLSGYTQQQSQSPFDASQQVPLSQFQDPLLFPQQFPNNQFSQQPLIDNIPTADNLFPEADPSIPLPTFDNSLIALGLEEAMPDRDIIDDLNRLFYERIHNTMPILHQARYMASMNLPLQKRPPVCLQYAIWALAAHATEGYEEIHQHFYQRARKYAERDEMKAENFGFSIVSVSHCQAWTFLGAYEFRMTFFPRAWMSIGRSARLSAMLGLHKVKVQQGCSLPTPSDCIEQEERRRTFWMLYCQDRYASSGAAWPQAIDDNIISIQLPCRDDAFESGLICDTLTIDEALKPGASAKLSSFASVVVSACLLGRNASVMNKIDAHEDASRMDGNVWKQHRAHDKTLLDFVMFLPPNLRLPSGITDPGVVLMTLTVHSATITLHKAAVMRAENNGLPQSFASQSKMRCIAAAQEIASIMRILSYRDIRATSPFVLHNLAVAAGVFVQYLRSRPDDDQVRDCLDFLVKFMQSVSSHSRLADAFLVSLESDLADAGITTTSETANRWQSKQLRRLKSGLDEICPSEEETTSHSVKYDLFGDGQSAKAKRAAAAAKQIPMRSRDGFTTTDQTNLNRVSTVSSREDTSATTPYSSGGGADTSNRLQQTSSRVSTISSATPPASVHDSTANSGAKNAMSSPQIINDDGCAGDDVMRDFSMANGGVGNGDVPTNGMGMGSDTLLNNMTDADWKQMMDVSMADMGWNAGVPTG